MLLSTACLPRLAAATFAIVVPAAAWAQDLQQQVARSGTPGAAVAVVRGDRVV